MTPVSILDAVHDPAVFEPWFAKPETWRGWFVFLAALFGLPMTEDDRALFEKCTGRAEAPAGGVREAWLVVGRRGGKSLILSVTAVYLACFLDWLPYLTPGERGTIMVIGADKRQARTILRYITALLVKVPMLAALVERETQDAIDLTNGVTIEITTASFRTTRGYTLVAALADEIAFWRSEENSANPDSEIIAAIRPAMATIPAAMLLCASSPYARRGALWKAYHKHFGKDGPVLVWKADTETMNPTVPKSVIEEAFESDPASAAAEFGAEFRTDVETFVSREVVDAAVVTGRHELPPVPGNDYMGFTDPSGGSSDSFTLAIAHRDRFELAILDVIREMRPPFSPESVVREFCTLLKAYGISTVCGDRYAGEWPRERFREHGIGYLCAEKPKSDIYRDVLPMLNSGNVELLDNPRLISQLCGLERRTARGGRDSIDHPPSGHDDLINSACGALLMAETPRNADMIFGSLGTRTLQPRPEGYAPWLNY